MALRCGEAVALQDVVGERVEQQNGADFLQAALYCLRKANALGSDV